GQVVAHLDVEVTALERAQRGEQLAAIELFAGRLARGLAAIASVRLGRVNAAHRSSFPYRARMILSALAGLTMWASKPASRACARSAAWPKPVIAIRRSLS